MVTSGWGDKRNKSCLSMVPKMTLWAMDRHTLDYTSLE